MRVVEATHFAELARHIVTRIPQIPGSIDLYVSATAHLANAWRVGNERRKANDLFVLARQVMKEHGVTDPRIVARVDDLLGSLRTDQCRFPQAERLLKRAAMLFGVVGAVEDAARVLIKLGNSYRLRGDLSNAIEATRSALGFLGPHADFNLHVAGHYNLALQLVQAERFEEAADLLEEDQGLYRRAPEPWLQLRLGWLRGDIAAGRGELDVAGQAYRETRDGFVALGSGYDAATVSLDLALLYLRQGRTVEARQVADEVAPIFAAQDVHREALAALTLFQKTAR
jgi:tetratricopeptide (TPR) repeat protein